MKPINEQYQDAVEAQTPAQSFVSEIARVARVSVGTAHAWVLGYQKPSPASMALLSAYFNTPEDALFSEGHFDNLRYS